MPLDQMTGDPRDSRYQCIRIGIAFTLGNEAFIVMAIQQGLIKPYFSDEMIEEYVKVLARPKFSFPPDEIHALIDLIRSRGEQISHSQPLSLHSPDPADKLLACAVTAAADFIVTGNKQTFSSGSVRHHPRCQRRRASQRITFEM